MDRAPRHSAMVDFLQHQQRLYVVLEEDHEKVEKERDQLKEENERLYDSIRYEEARFRRELDQSERLRVVTADLLFAAQFDPSCQHGLVERCRCFSCAANRARAAISAEEVKT